MAGKVSINNVACSWSMIQLKSSITGDQGGENGLLIDCTGIEWNTKRNQEMIYGLGGQPRSRGFGNVEYTASIDLPLATQMTLRKKSVNGTLMGLGDFDLIVSFTNDLASNLDAEVITIKQCLISEGGMSAKQGDASISNTFNLNPFRIYNAAAQASASWSFEMYAK